MTSSTLRRLLLYGTLLLSAALGAALGTGRVLFVLGALSLVTLFAAAVWAARRSTRFWTLAVMAIFIGGLLQEALLAQPGAAAIVSMLRYADLVALMGILVVAVPTSKSRVPRWMWLLPLGLVAVQTIDWVVLGFPFALYYLGAVTYLKYFVLAYAIALKPLSTEGLRVLLRVVAIVVIACAALAVAQFATGATVDLFRGTFPLATRGQWFRAIGFFPWPIELALFAGIAFFPLYSMRAESKLYFLGAFGALICVTLSLTRWAVVVMVALIVLYYVLRRSLRGGALVVVTVSAAGFVLGAGVLEVFTSDLPIYLSGSAPRIAYLLQGVRVWADHPLFGVGFARYGSQWAAAIEGQSLLSTYGIGSYDLVKTTDSFLASALPEMGLVGVGILVTYYAAAIRRAVFSGLARPQSLGFALAICFAVLSVMNSASSLYAPHTILYWIFIGQTVGEWSRRNENTEGEKIASGEFIRHQRSGSVDTASRGESGCES